MSITVVKDNPSEVLSTLVTQFNQLLTDYGTHTHSGVTSGTHTSGAVSSATSAQDLVQVT